MADDLERLGAPADLVARERAAAQAAETAHAVDVWPENWPVVTLFFRLQTQWRLGASGATGLDYHAARMVAETVGLTWDAFLLDDLQILESEALTAWAAARRQAEAKARQQRRR